MQLSSYHPATIHAIPFLPCNTPPPATHAARKRQRSQPLQRKAVAGSGTDGQQLGVLLELDGVLVDTHRDGHRTAFNRAFKRTGLSSAHWSPTLYQELLTAGDGSADAMLAIYFGTVGWPTSVGGKQKPGFLKRLHALKQEELNNMVDDAQLPLRTGVDRFLKDALSAGAKVGVLAATNSAPRERIAQAAFAALPRDITQSVRLFTLGEESEAGLEGDDKPEVSLEALMSDAKARVKQNEAQAFVKAHAMSNPNSSVSMTMAPGLQASSRISAAWLQACSTLLGLSVANAAMIAASSSTMQKLSKGVAMLLMTNFNTEPAAARGAGLLSLAVPPPVASRGTYKHADARFDGFGSGGGIKWAHIPNKLASRQQRFGQNSR